MSGVDLTVSGVGFHYKPEPEPIGKKRELIDFPNNGVQGDLPKEVDATGKPEKQGSVVPLEDLFSQISSEPGSAPTVNNMSPHFTTAVQQIQETQKQIVLAQAEMQFQMTQAKLVSDRMGGIISAQQYEDGIREAQKAFTDKTGEPAPLGMPDPV